MDTQGVGATGGCGCGSKAGGMSELNDALSKLEEFLGKDIDGNGTTGSVTDPESAISGLMDLVEGEGAGEEGTEGAENAGGNQQAGSGQGGCGCDSGQGTEETGASGQQDVNSALSKLEELLGEDLDQNGEVGNVNNPDTALSGLMDLLKGGDQTQQTASTQQNAGAQGHNC